jgi:hypothetical protein
MDCGRYDRSGDDREQEEAEAKRLAKIRLEEEEMMTLRPITTDKLGGKSVTEQDTSLPDGFLRKLGKQDEKKFKKVGILSPEEGAGMFADMGNNMFGNKEDRELIESIQGRGDSADSSSSGGGRSSKGVATSFSRESEDEDLLNSLRSQLGAKNLADISNIPDILNPTGDVTKGKGSAPTPAQAAPSKKSTGAPAPAASIFDTRVDMRTKREEDLASTPPPAAPSSSVSAFTREPVTLRPVAADVFETPAPPASSGPQYGPALTTQEAEKLQDSLDDMTDDEVAAVLAKLRNAVSDRIKEEVSDAMTASGMSRGEGEVKKMPRAASVNAGVREKFSEELTAIEDELEKIYSDPLGTWQEMMANPEKFLEENEIGPLSGGTDN